MFKILITQILSNMVTVLRQLYILGVFSCFSTFIFFFRRWFSSEMLDCVDSCMLVRLKTLSAQARVLGMENTYTSVLQGALKANKNLIVLLHCIKAYTVLMFTVHRVCAKIRVVKMI